MSSLKIKVSQKAIFITTLLILLLFALSGCFHLTPRRTVIRETGFRYFDSHFNSIENSEDLFEFIEIKNLKIYIVGSKEQFDWEKARRKNSTITAYARQNEIWLIGKRVKDKDGKTKIIINQAVLGHELQHIFNFKKPIVINPDDLEELGL